MASYNKLLICENEHHQILTYFFSLYAFSIQKCTIHLKYYVTYEILYKEHVMMKQGKK